MPPTITSSEATRSSRRRLVAFAIIATIALSGAIGGYYLWFRGQELATLRGHHGTVNDLAFHKDGMLLASCATDGTIRFWDLSRNRQKQLLSGHTGPIYALAFSPTGATLASSGEDKTIRFWDTTSGTETAKLGPGGAMPCLAYSPDGKILAAGGAKVIRFWDTATLKQGPDLIGHTGRVHCLAFTADGKWLVSGADDKTVRVWDAAAGKATGRILQLKGDVRSLAVSPSPTSDNATVAIASKGSAVRLWNLATGEEADPFPRVALTESMSFSPDGKRLATAHDDGLVRIWNVADRIEMRAFKGHKGSVRVVQFAPDGKTLASGGIDDTIKRWRVEK